MAKTTPSKEGSSRGAIFCFFLSSSFLSFFVFVFVFRARRRRGFRGLEQFGKFPSFPVWELQPEMNQHPTTAAAAAGNIIIIILILIITVPIIR
jgi:hypothetical protein